MEEHVKVNLSSYYLDVGCATGHPLQGQEPPFLFTAFGGTKTLQPFTEISYTSVSVLDFITVDNGDGKKKRFL